MEVFGGIGYIEEAPLARLYRQAPLNSIWEGSGNIMRLDLLRAFSREPETLTALEAELAAAGGRHPAYDRYLARLKDEMTDPASLESRGRRLIEKVALATQACLLLRYAPDFVSAAFCASRLGGEGGAAFGTLPGNTAFAALLARAWPQ